MVLIDDSIVKGRIRINYGDILQRASFIAQKFDGFEKSLQETVDRVINRNNKEQMVARVHVSLRDGTVIVQCYDDRGVAVGKEHEKNAEVGWLLDNLVNEENKAREAERERERRRQEAEAREEKRRQEAEKERRRQEAEARETESYRLEADRAPRRKRDAKQGHQHHTTR